MVVAPTMCFGVSHHHLAFAGTLSLTTNQYLEAVKELVRCLYRHGVRQVVLLNGHGGNTVPNASVAQALVHEEGLPLAIGHAPYWTVAARALEEAGAAEIAPRFPGHAGGFETSLLLALRPDLGALDKRRPPLATLDVIGHAAVHGNFARAGGTSDDASRADAAAGKRLLDAAIGAVADYLVSFYERTRAFPTGEPPASSQS